MIDAYRNFNADVLAYSPSLGIPQLRQSIADYYQRYGHPVSPQEVAVTVGGSEAIFFALSAVCDPGDEILVREPFYANYIAFAAMISAKVVPIPSSLDNGYALPSREEIARYITPRTKAILYISPENPTGIVYDRREMETLRELCERFGLYLIAGRGLPGVHLRRARAVHVHPRACGLRAACHPDRLRLQALLLLRGAHRVHRLVQQGRDGARRQVCAGAVCARPPSGSWPRMPPTGWTPRISLPSRTNIAGAATPS